MGYQATDQGDVPLDVVGPFTPPGQLSAFLLDRNERAVAEIKSYHNTSYQNWRVRRNSGEPAVALLERCTLSSAWERVAGVGSSEQSLATLNFLRVTEDCANPVCVGCLDVELRLRPFCPSHRKHLRVRAHGTCTVESQHSLHARYHQGRNLLVVNKKSLSRELRMVLTEAGSCAVVISIDAFNFCAALWKGFPLWSLKLMNWVGSRREVMLTFLSLLATEKLLQVTSRCFAAGIALLFSPPQHLMF